MFAALLFTHVKQIAPLTALLLGVLAMPTSANVNTSTSIQASSASIAPPITGSFDDLTSPVWKKAIRASAFQNYTARTTAPDDTQSYLVFGPDSIYCAFVVNQSHATILAKQTTNGAGLGLDDYVAVMFDTSGNGTNQYFFETTPVGVRYQSASESTRYNPQWTAVAKIDGDRWLAELVIPYRFIRGNARGWRVNFVRYVATTQQFLTWAYDRNMGSPFDETFWPKVDNAPDLAHRIARPTAQIYGLTSSGRDARVFEGSAGEITSLRGRTLGLDAKIPITSSLNFDGTLNPDFSNLEKDQQIIAPQEFRYRYAEYRPFFTQGANYLPGSDVFYSPGIGVFDHGEKLEGQVGHFGLGVLNVGRYGSSDRAYALAYTAPNQETTVSFTGAQGVRSSRTDSVNEIGVFNQNLASQIGFGASTAIESGAFTTDSARARKSIVYANVNKPNYYAGATYVDIGPAFNPIDAFTQQSDIRGPSFYGGLISTTKPDSPVRDMYISAYGDRYLDRSGAVRESDVGFYASLTSKNLLSFGLGQSSSTLRSYTNYYPKYSDGTTSPYDQSNVSVNYRSGTPDNAGVFYSWGTFSSMYLQQLRASVSHQFSQRYSANFIYNQVDERSFVGLADGQILRRLSIRGALSRDQTLDIAYRTIVGTGGFSAPGQNFALGYFRRFKSGSTLQAEIGSPAASRTLDRYVLKYVLFLGSGAGQ